MWLKPDSNVSDITVTMRLPMNFSRWSRRSSLLAPSSLRVEVCPPSLRHAPASLWNRVVFWMMAPAPLDCAPPPQHLPVVRHDFQAMLADIASPEADGLRRRIDCSHSLRELWHLRADAYRVVGVAHSQSEAELRLAQLNHHFPTRAPRSQFAAL